MLLKGPCPCRRVCLGRKEEEGSVLSREVRIAEWYVNSNICMLCSPKLSSQRLASNPHRPFHVCRHSAMLLRLWQQLLVHRSFHIS